MRTLYHWSFDPASRQARIALAETKLKFKLETVNPWAPSEVFLQRCIEGRPPALIDHTQDNNRMIAGARAICEYANEITTRLPLMPKEPFARAEVRRLCDWFDVRLSEEVHGYILGERLEKAINAGGAPDPEILQQGRQNLEFQPILPAGRIYHVWIISVKSSGDNIRRLKSGTRHLNLARVCAIF